MTSGVPDKRVIELDASRWQNVLDYSSALKVALGSCHGHGDSPDAWVDSMIYGGMNAIEPPYVIRIIGTSGCPQKLKDEFALLDRVIREARAWRVEHYGDDRDVTFQIEP